MTPAGIVAMNRRPGTPADLVAALATIGDGPLTMRQARAVDAAVEADDAFLMRERAARADAAALAILDRVPDAPEDGKARRRVLLSRASVPCDMSAPQPFRAAMPGGSVIRRHIAFGPGHAVDDRSVRGFGKALLTAHYLAERSLGVAVVDPEGTVVRRFGEVPADAFAEDEDDPDGPDRGA